MSKILLINPTVDIAHVRKDWAMGASQPPQGLAFLASYLKMHGHEVKIIDMLVDAYGPKDLADLIRIYSPDIVGISTYTQVYETCLTICRFIKHKFAYIVTVLGGPHVTSLPEATLTEESAVDFVIMGEGECTFIELLEYLRCPQAICLRDIRGLAYRVEDEIHINPEREHIQQLDILPFYERDGLRLERYAGGYTLLSSRGCPGQCIFCAAGALSGSRQRRRSVENIFSEVYYLVTHYEATFLIITDDTFTVSHRRVRRFCELILASGITFHWRCESRVQGMNEDILKWMSAAGCVSIQYGVESGSQEVLNRIHKYLSLEKLPQVLQATNTAQITPICMFILGHYCDTPETMQKTLDLMRDIHSRYHAGVLLSINTPFPGTYQYIHRNELGLHFYSEAWQNFSPEVHDTYNVYTEYFDRDMLAHFYFAAQDCLMTRQQARKAFSGPLQKSLREP